MDKLLIGLISGAILALLVLVGLAVYIFVIKKPKNVSGSGTVGGIGQSPTGGGGNGGGSGGGNGGGPSGPKPPKGLKTQLNSLYDGAKVVIQIDDVSTGETGFVAVGGELPPSNQYGSVPALPYVENNTYQIFTAENVPNPDGVSIKFNLFSQATADTRLYLVNDPNSIGLTTKAVPNDKSGNYHPANDPNAAWMLDNGVITTGDGKSALAAGSPGKIMKGYSHMIVVALPTKTVTQKLYQTFVWKYDSTPVGKSPLNLPTPQPDPRYEYTLGLKLPGNPKVAVKIGCKKNANDKGSFTLPVLQDSSSDIQPLTWKVEKSISGYQFYHTFKMPLTGENAGTGQPMKMYLTSSGDDYLVLSPIKPKWSWQYSPSGILSTDKGAVTHKQEYLCANDTGDQMEDILYLNNTVSGDPLLWRNTQYVWSFDRV